MIWFFTKLLYFSNAHAVFLIYTLTQSAFNLLSEEEQDNMKFLFSKIDENTSSDILKEIVDEVNKTINRGNPFVVYEVSEGSNFNIVIKKKDENDNYQPYILVARENQTNDILAQQVALDNEVQLLFFEDLDLTQDNIYKIRIQLEIDTGAGDTTGDAVAELTTLFFVVSNNIDSE